MARLKLITLEDFLEMLTNNEHLKLVEVLTIEEYEEGHIPGAVNLPLNELEKGAGQKLKKTEKIVAYCESYTCHASTKAAKRLSELGYKEALDFKGGKRWWRHAGLELEK